MNEHHKEKTEASKKEVKHSETSKQDVVEIPVGKYLDKTRKNPWIISTFVLAIALVFVLVYNWGNFGGVTSVSPEQAGQNALTYINSNPNLQGQVQLSTVTKTSDGSFYQTTLSYQGQEVPVFVTLDGKYLLNQPVPLTASNTDNSNTNTDNTPSQPAPTNVPKTDKPKVEMFVMSHCPYGTQIEKGMLPVISALKDKADFEVKFVYYAMHGEKEVKEQLAQYCIQKEQKSKYWSYLQCFLEASDSEGCLTKEGIDKARLNACKTRADAEFKVTANFNNRAGWLSGSFPLFDIYKADNERYQVQGSPTLIINGVEANSGRDSASLLRAVCAAFNNAPEECNTDLSSFGSPGPGFGYHTDSGASASAANCVV